MPFKRYILSIRVYLSSYLYDDEYIIKGNVSTPTSEIPPRAGAKRTRENSPAKNNSSLREKPLSRGRISWRYVARRKAIHNLVRSCSRGSQDSKMIDDRPVPRIFTQALPKTSSSHSTNDRLVRDTVSTFTVRRAGRWRRRRRRPRGALTKAYPSAVFPIEYSALHTPFSPAERRRTRARSFSLSLSLPSHGV